MGKKKSGGSRWAGNGSSSPSRSPANARGSAAMSEQPNRGTANAMPLSGHMQSEAMVSALNLDSGMESAMQGFNQNEIRSIHLRNILYVFQANDHSQNAIISWNRQQ